MTRFKTERRCSGCSAAVSDYEVMYSMGTCPRCGYRGKGAVTVMDVTVAVYRLVPSGKWWQFWKFNREYTWEQTK